MSKRASKRGLRVLENRAAGHPHNSHGQFKDPGSQNPRKTYGRSRDWPRRRGG